MVLGEGSGLVEIHVVPWIKMELLTLTVHLFAVSVSFHIMVSSVAYTVFITVVYT